MNRIDFQQQLLSLQTNLLNFAISLTSNREDANDLLQDTTLKALDNEDKFAPESNFKGWVFTIMRNIFINKYRRMVRSSTVIDSSDDQYLLNAPENDTALTPEDTMAEKEITATINSFPDAYRVPFSLYVAGYHYGEIAERMSLPLGTVKSRIFYARKYLQDRLSEYDPR